MSPSEAEIRRRGTALFYGHLDVLRRGTDKVFIILMPGQWILGMLLALWYSPLAWAGNGSGPNIHLLAAFILGGLITSYPLHLTLQRPGERLTRRIVAAGQMLMSALLIHLTGGRIESHFHIFGSLAILSFYRDWSVLFTALLVVIADHGARGVLAPQSVYGVAQVQPLRFLEHVGWIMFEITPLFYLIRQSRREVRESADRQAELELTNEEVEDKVLERTRELREANERAALDREAAKEIDRMKERQQLHHQFLANVSHDLRTPIASIKGYAETLRQGGIDDVKRRLSFVRTIEKNAERLGVLVENLLDLAMLDGLKVQPRPAVIPIDDCLAELATDFGPQARRKKVLIRVGAAEPLHVHADAGHVWQVMQNLLSNAVKFSPLGGTISVWHRREGERVAISVADEGPGIPKSELELIFKRFHSDARGNKTREGSGLGLAIARTLAELNGGTLVAHHAEGRGALFTFSLPAAGFETAPN